jgi:hypothetical protein
MINKIESIEEALQVMADKIASDQFAEIARSILEDGEKVVYELVIKKGNQPGYVISLGYKKATPLKNIMTFLRVF